MQAQTDYQYRLIQEYRAAQIQEASNARLFRQPEEPGSRHSVRRAIGYQIMRIGARLAADPAPEPARAR